MRSFIKRKMQIDGIFDRIFSTINMVFDDLAFDSGTVNDLCERFAQKHGLQPGFQGDYNLRSLFGDLVDDQSFVRDRVRDLSGFVWSFMIFR